MVVVASVAFVVQMIAAESGEVVVRTTLKSSGDGYFELSFIPEPSTALLLGLGLLALSTKRKAASRI